MKQVRTNDSSYTLYSEEYTENYHSVSGALEEALKKFIEPCGIRDGMNILDIGFGLGYNVGVAMFKAKNLKIISLEKDTAVLRSLKTIKVPYWFANTYEKIKHAAQCLEFSSKDTELHIMLGDARETIRQILTTKEENKFDAVFLDPFSPPKNPELWTVEFFKDIKKRMKKNAVLATYSCARVARDNLREAGFEVKDGPVVGRKSPGTLAINSNSQNPCYTKL